MKKIAIIFGLLLISISFSFSQKITPLDTNIWNTNYELSKKISFDKKMPLMMVFSGSDWCKPCIKLREQILIDSIFTNWAEDSIVCLCVDFPTQKKNQLNEELKIQNEMLAEKYNLNGIFPLVLIFSYDGEVLGNLGFENITTFEYIEKIKNIINN